MPPETAEAMAKRDPPGAWWGQSDGASDRFSRLSPRPHWVVADSNLHFDGEGVRRVAAAVVANHEMQRPGWVVALCAGIEQTVSRSQYCRWTNERRSAERAEIDRGGLELPHRTPRACVGIDADARVVCAYTRRQGSRNLCTVAGLSSRQRPAYQERHHRRRDRARQGSNYR